MGRKRSKGVTFWGWFFIIASIIGLLSARNPHAIIRLYGVIGFVFVILSDIAYIVCGIFILRLSEKARKAVIILSIICIISIPFCISAATNLILDTTKNSSAFTVQKQKIEEQMKPEYQQQALEELEKSRKIGKTALPIVLIIMFGIPWLITELIPIYFFTRPKVKEQFKP